MAELALGVLGIVPLVGVAIKSYKTLTSKLRAFRHCSSTVHRVYKKLRVQRRIFKNECHLLLRHGVDDEAAIRDLMSDFDHRGWNNQDWEKHLRVSLKENYDECAEHVRDIIETIRRLEAEFCCFQAVEAKQQKGERLKDAWKRLEDGLRISFKGGSYEAEIADLRTANNDLISLRDQSQQLQQTHKDRAVKRSASGQLEWADIQRASKALHDALVNVWSCSQASHARHLMALFLEAEKPDENVRMTMAILCQEHGPSPSQADLIPLQVKSRNIQRTSNLRSSMRPSPPEKQRPQKRTKMGRFYQDSAVPCSPQKQIQSLDLRFVEDICFELTTQHNEKKTEVMPNCLGYIDTQSKETHRHQFFSSMVGFFQNTHSSVIAPGDLISMDTALYDTTNVSLSTVEKLSLAKSLVSAVLKFHATPWLREVWGLQDVSFFHQDGEDLAQSLRTLHLGIELNPKEVQTTSPDSSMRDIWMTPSSNRLSHASEADRLLCGIDNIALHCLGVALLQIERLEKIEPDDVLGVRKLARSGSTFGPRYHEITQKCLRCDFGYRADLGKVQLQNAVYESIVVSLESMITCLSLGDDDVRRQQATSYPDEYLQ
ncbi:hypothetical protein B0T10DRAFT_283521 [Thelonectria olida]|uniref:DUF7580 domain-containing protein n=1 Tax=Thelonectria olida TaxID=1576542 RepID=A0A9P9ATY3_9HYPO|nr:hypothetical protein B0T10DRAFT_283521 [Thelonectria olida]